LRFARSGSGQACRYLAPAANFTCLPTGKSHKKAVLLADKELFVRFASFCLPVSGLRFACLSEERCVGTERGAFMLPRKTMSDD